MKLFRWEPPGMSVPWLSGEYVRDEDAERYATFGRLVIADGYIGEEEVEWWKTVLADLREKKWYDDEEVEPGETFRQRWNGEIAKLEPMIAAYRAIEKANEQEEESV